MFLGNEDWTGGLFVHRAGTCLHNIVQVAIVLNGRLAYVHPLTRWSSSDKPQDNTLSLFLVHLQETEEETDGSCKTCALLSLFEASPEPEQSSKVQQKTISGQYKKSCGILQRTMKQAEESN